MSSGESGKNPSVLDGCNGPGEAVRRLPVPRLGAHLEQAAGHQAHAVQVQLDQVVERSAVLGARGQSAGHVRLQGLYPVDVDLNALVRELGASAPPISGEVGPLPEVPAELRDRQDALRVGLGLLCIGGRRL